MTLQIPKQKRSISSKEKSDSGSCIQEDFIRNGGKSADFIREQETFWKYLSYKHHQIWKLEISNS